MGKIKTLFLLPVLWTISAFSYAQNSLDAEIISGDIDVCNNSSVEVNIDIKFYGNTPFMFKYRSQPNTIEESTGYIYAEDLDANNVYQHNFTVGVSIPDGQPNESFQIQITDVSNDGNNWIPTTDTGITFTNWAMPSPDAGAEIDSCGLTAVLNATPDPLSSDYVWESPAQGTLSDPNATDSHFSALSTGTFPLTFSQTNGACNAQDNVNVILRGNPAASISTTSEVCGTSPQSAAIDLAFEGTYSPWEYALIDNNNNEITGTSSSASHSENVTVEGETTYSILWIKDVNGCISNPEDLSGSATVTDLQPATDAGEDFLSCGLITSMSAIADKGTGEWSSENSQIIISSPSDPNSQISATEQGNYLLTWTENNNGCKNSDEVVVTFKELPVINFTKKETRICEGSDAEFPFSIAPNNGPWTLEYLTEEIPESATFENASSILITSPTANNTIEITSITDNFGCESQPAQILTVLVDQMPATFAGNDTAVCGLELKLNAQQSNEAQSGEWQFSSGSILNNETDNPKATYQQSNYGEYTLNWTEVNGLCTASDDILVRFDEAPVAYAGKDFTLFNQDETPLHARLPVASTEEWAGEWYIVSGSGSLTNPESTDALLTGLKHGTVTLDWTVSNGACPEDKDQLTITIKGLTYHTGISPNQDGLNDYFSIKGAHTIPQNELVVFDQNGKVVFRKTNLEEGNQWNGTENNGEPLENGIYYFIFEGDGIDPIKDYIVIKRNY